ncbi:unnamed protein product [Notodromas monacha]|uniref:C2H2-type domain-containing protein n=1 Tax=Notodromas monacha TaxID=399045 RepID=A0A7R9BL16_9CRUS|nr:unnamed protein product [Notodromas monacha]CAG0917439.1 unnamed protein product [Notodromas monacha]
MLFCETAFVQPVPMDNVVSLNAIENFLPPRTQPSEFFFVHNLPGIHNLIADHSYCAKLEDVHELVQNDDVKYEVEDVSHSAWFESAAVSDVLCAPDSEQIEDISNFVQLNNNIGSCIREALEVNDFDEHRNYFEKTPQCQFLSENAAQYPVDTPAVLCDLKVLNNCGGLEEKNREEFEISGSESGGSILESVILKDSAEIVPACVAPITSKPKVGRPRSSLTARNCEECGKGFLRNSDFLAHKRTHAEGKPFTCDVCPKKFSQLAKLNAHRGVHSGNRPFTCEVCGKSFTRSTVLLQHQRIHSGEKPYACGECGKSYAQSYQLIAHKRTHSGERPYLCPDCGKSFITSTDLNIHRRTHSGLRPYVCDYCGKTFSRSHTLTIHRRSHTGEKPYPCTFCGKAFVSSADLNHHKRTHTGERPYVCSECGKTCTQSAHLSQHMMSHRKHRVFQCDQCEKAYIRNSHLIRHKRTHTNERPFRMDDLLDVNIWSPRDAPPSEVKSLEKYLCNLDSRVVEKLKKAALKSICGKSLTPSTWKKLVLECHLLTKDSDVPLDATILATVFAALLSLYGCLFQHSPSKLKKGLVKQKLQNLKLPSEFIEDFLETFFGDVGEEVRERIGAINSGSLSVASVDWAVNGTISTRDVISLMQPYVKMEMRLTDGNVMGPKKKSGVHDDSFSSSKGKRNDDIYACAQCGLYMSGFDAGDHQIVDCETTRALNHSFALVNHSRAFLRGKCRFRNPSQEGLANCKMNAIMLNPKAIKICGFFVGKEILLREEMSSSWMVCIVLPDKTLPPFDIGVSEQVSKLMNIKTSSICILQSLESSVKPCDYISFNVRAVMDNRAGSNLQEEDVIRKISKTGFEAFLKSELVGIRLTSQSILPVNFFGLALDLIVTSCRSSWEDNWHTENEELVLSMQNLNVTEDEDRLELKTLDVTGFPDSESQVEFPEGAGVTTFCPLGASTPHPKKAGSSRRKSKCVVALNLLSGDSPTVYRIHSSTCFSYSAQMRTEECSASGLDSDALTLDHVGGMDNIIKYLLECIDHSHREKSFGLFLPPTGVLLHGPAGTGKSLLGRCLSEKFGKNFLSIRGADVFSKFAGDTERELRKKFDEAKRRSPSVIFMDDVESLCAKKEGNSRTEQESRVLSALLTMLDELRGPPASRVIVIATTSKLSSIDPAIRRSGRFDRELEIGVPNAAERFDILEKILSRTSHSVSATDTELIAAAAHGYVGADLALVCAEAAAAVAREMLASESRTITVTRKTLEAALKSVKPSAMKEISVDIPQVKWSDIGGMEELKMKLKQSVSWPLMKPEAFLRMGVRPPRGLLMYGPPGCSKTLFAKALASESGLNFVSVKSFLNSMPMRGAPFEQTMISVEKNILAIIVNDFQGPELFSKWVGESESAVREIFRKARRCAPSIIFFDEIDAIAGTRSSGGSSSGGANVQERVLAQMLTEMDGVVELNNVMVVAATNRPDMVDPALLRPGRLDRIVYVPLPDASTRTKIFEIHLRNTPVSDNVRFCELSEKTEGYSGAEIVAVCQEAAMKALQESFDATAVSENHFRAALEKMNICPMPLVGEQYYLEKSKKAATLIEAKSVIHSGTLQFPNCFKLEYEGYKLSKQHVDSQQGAKSMEILIRKFSNHKEVVEEEKKILAAVRNQLLMAESELGLSLSAGTTFAAARSEETFLCNLFDALDKETLCKLLENELVALDSRNSTEDSVNKCCVLLILIRKLPENISSGRGMSLYRMLEQIDASRQDIPPAVLKSIHVLRRVLVGEVLPHVIPLKDSFPTWEHLAEMLSSSIEFSIPIMCGEIAVHRASRPSSYFEDDRDLAAGGDGKTSWRKLISILHAVVKKLDRGLKITSWFSSSSSIEGVTAKLTALVAESKSSEKLKGTLGQQIGCSLAVLIVRCVLEYGALLWPLSPVGEVMWQAKGTLVEGFAAADPWPVLFMELGDMTDESNRSNFGKLIDENIVTVSPHLDSLDSSTLVSAFANLKSALSLTKCNDIVHKRFMVIFQRISWNTFAPLHQSVMADVALAEKKYEAASEFLKEASRLLVQKPRNSRASDTSTVFRSLEDFVSIGLRTTSYLFSTGQKADAASEAIEILIAVWRHSSGQDDNLNFLNASSSLTEALSPLAMDVIPNSGQNQSARPVVLKKGSLSIEDEGFGFMMVLMQLDWPLDEIIFNEGCKRITAKQKFACPFFLEYISEKYFLDAFAAIAVGSEPVQLDIFRNDSNGVTDWRTAFVQRMQQPRVPMLECVAKFLTEMHLPIMTFIRSNS